jgi:hypothetical protein
MADRFPLPEPYRAGLRYVLYYDQFDRPAFLFGRHYRGGNLASYPAMLAIKNPVVTLAAWTGAVGAILFGGRRLPGRRAAQPGRTNSEVMAASPGAEPEATAHPPGDELDVGAFERRAHPTGIRRATGRVWPGIAPSGRVGLTATLLLLPAWMFTLAMQSGTNIGYRHILVVPAFLTVATGVLAGLRVRGRRVAVAAVALVLLAGVSAWRVYPSYLAYTSELFGGPDQGYRLVADSNLDWGQDLARAARYVHEEHPGERTYLLYFGTARQSAYGLNAVDLRRLPRWDLDELDGVVLASASTLALYDDPRFNELRGREPIAQIGHSILVYRVP